MCLSVWLDLINPITAILAFYRNSDCWMMSVIKISVTEVRREASMKEMLTCTCCIVAHNSSSENSPSCTWHRSVPLHVSVTPTHDCETFPRFNLDQKDTTRDEIPWQPSRIQGLATVYCTRFSRSVILYNIQSAGYLLNITSIFDKHFHRLALTQI